MATRAKTRQGAARLDGPVGSIISTEVITLPNFKAAAGAAAEKVCAEVRIPEIRPPTKIKNKIKRQKCEPVKSTAQPKSSENFLLGSPVSPNPFKNAPLPSEKKFVRRQFPSRQNASPFLHTHLTGGSNEKVGLRELPPPFRKVKIISSFQRTSLRCREVRKVRVALESGSETRGWGGESRGGRRRRIRS